MFVTTTKERPILFSGPMVRAIIDGRKTQTRRVITPRLGGLAGMGFWGYDHDDGDDTPYSCFGTDELGLVHRLRCPYGDPGDRLWVRETWVYHFGSLMYRADCHPDSFHYEAKGWKPSIHMPRKLSRITLEVTGVRVERVQSISEADAIAEGVDAVSMADVPRQATMNRRADFKQLWDGINAKRGYSWESNPWVWVVEFKRVQP